MSKTAIINVSTSKGNKMTIIFGNWRDIGRTSLVIIALGLVNVGLARATDADDAEAISAIDNVKKSLKKKDYNRMWQQMDKLTAWLEANAPRDGLSWTQAEQMIKVWIKTN